MASKIPPSERLAAWLARQRWFAGKGRAIASLTVDDTIPLGGAVIAIAAVELADGERQGYAVPLVAGDDVVDALDDARFTRALLELVRVSGRAHGERGAVHGHATSAFPEVAEADCRPRRLGGEQSNTSIAFGDALMLKHFRRLAPGVNPELDVTRFLTEHTSFRHSPRLVGHIEYARRDGATATLAVVQQLIPRARDGWQWVLDELRGVFDRVRGEPSPTPARVTAVAGATLRALARLGTTTAELHRALASGSGDPAFAPEAITGADVDLWRAAVEHELDEARTALANTALARGVDVTRGLGGLVGRTKIRHHGDFHLGQTLYRPDLGDFVIIDFEGEPLRPIAERTRKHTPLRDVAGMLRSIDYAAVSAMPDGLDRWARAWHAAAVGAFTRAYRDGVAGASFVPDTNAAFGRAVAVFELEKAAYEVIYETRHRPDWVAIPADGLRRAAAALTAMAEPGAA